MGGFAILGWCHGEPEIINSENKQVRINYSKMREFIRFQSQGLKEITDWLKMSEDEYKSILNISLGALGFDNNQNL